MQGACAMREAAKTTTEETAGALHLGRAFVINTATYEDGRCAVTATPLSDRGFKTTTNFSFATSEFRLLGLKGGDTIFVVFLPDNADYVVVFIGLLGSPTRLGDLDGSDEGTLFVDDNGYVHFYLRRNSAHTTQPARYCQTSGKWVAYDKETKVEHTTTVVRLLELNAMPNNEGRSNMELAWIDALGRYRETSIGQPGDLHYEFMAHRCIKMVGGEIKGLDAIDVEIGLFPTKGGPRLHLLRFEYRFNHTDRVWEVITFRWNDRNGAFEPIDLAEL